MREQTFALFLACVLSLIVAPITQAVTRKMDFNNDGYGDLAIGAPQATVNRISNAGTVTVLYGKAVAQSDQAPELSAIDSQLWTIDTALNGASPDTHERFGAELAAGDFNNDGYTDLAIGAASLVQSGKVIVMYGSESGLRGFIPCLWGPCTPKPQVFRMHTVPLPGGAGSDAFGQALAVADFNGDTYDDLAVGARDHIIPNIGPAGGVRVFYGSATGLSSGNSLLLTLATTAMDGGPPSPGDRFGQSLAAGHFNGDIYADLAIGIPFKSLGGAVSVVYGSVSGLSPSPASIGGPFEGSGGNKLWTLSEAGFSSSGPNDAFGLSLTSGNFGNGKQDDLAIGTPFFASSKGLVLVLYGGPSGLTKSGAHRWDLYQLGIAATAQDQFGLVLAAGNLGSRSLDDLAIGIPGKDVAGFVDAGAVAVLFGTAAGLSAAGNQLLVMNTAFPMYNSFGYVLSVAQFGGDAFADLAIGTQRTERVSIRYGSVTGASPDDDQTWHSGIPGVPGIPEFGYGFGHALSK